MTWLYIPRPPYEHHPEAVNYISVCSGGGGLDVGVRLANPDARCVCYVEREASAATALVAAMEAGALDKAPVFSDARAFDGRRWRGRVAGVVGGTPCQDLSLAGKRAGLGGQRSSLFWDFIRIVRDAEPEWVLWENVGGAASALPAVFSAFEAEGYRGAWCRLRASDVGATHGRARVFVLAHRHDVGRDVLAGPWGDDAGLSVVENHGRDVAHRDGAALRQQPGWGRRPRGSGEAEPGLTGAGGDARDVAHRPSLGWGEGRAQPAGLGGGPDASECSRAVGDRYGQGLEERGTLGGDGAAQRAAPGGAGLASMPLWPPGPADVEGWKVVLQPASWLAPALSQPGIRGVVDGMALASGGLDRIELLRLLGNGVVPEQAAAAIRLMSNHLFGRPFP